MFIIKNTPVVWHSYDFDLPCIIREENFINPTYTFNFSNLFFVNNFSGFLFIDTLSSLFLYLQWSGCNKIFLSLKRNSASQIQL